MNRGRRKYVESFSPELNGVSIPTLKGRLIQILGNLHGQKPNKILETARMDECKRICHSKLTDWQKIDAINCFVMSKANFPLRLSP